MTSNPTLLDSAKEFLVEALGNHSAGNPKFAVLHAVTATELVLKERLARIHPSLIYRNIDCSDFRDADTVSLSKLPQRLLNFGVALKPKEAQIIGTFAKWRNEIAHHMPSFDRRAVNRQLPELLNFLTAFLHQELSTQLEDFLPRSLFRAASRILREWKRILQSSITRAQAEGHVISQACPDCGATQVLCLRHRNRVLCHLCKSRKLILNECAGCNRKMVFHFYPGDTEYRCDECVDQAGDRYIQSMIDFGR
jgi:hypothetical protein